MVSLKPDVGVRAVGADMHGIRADAVEAGRETEVDYLEAGNLDRVDGDFGEGAHRDGECGVCVGRENVGERVGVCKYQRLELERGQQD